MKAILAILVVAVLIASAPALAAPDSGSGKMNKLSLQAENDTGQVGGQPMNITTNQTAGGNQTGQQTREDQQTQNQGENQNLTIRERNQVNSQQLGQLIQQRQQEMNRELQQLQGSEAQKAMYQNQNRVRLAVHAFKAMENSTGGIGRNVSQIAREFNNSVQATIRAEQRIQARDGLTKFFVGGDEVAAEELEMEADQNTVRIQELRQLMQNCECDEEAQAMLMDQIRNIELEQNRLKQLAQSEKNNKGIFGWLWK